MIFSLKPDFDRIWLSLSLLKAFWMNEWRIDHPEEYVEKPRKVAYYKVFGKEIIIDDKEINVFIEHNVTIYYK